MTYRTYRVGGNFISVDESTGRVPVNWDESWEITKEAYDAIYAATVPEVTETGELDVLDVVFPPSPDEPPPPEGGIA